MMVPTSLRIRSENSASPAVKKRWGVTAPEDGVVAHVLVGQLGGERLRVQQQRAPALIAYGCRPVQDCDYALIELAPPLGSHSFTCGSRIRRAIGITSPHRPGDSVAEHRSHGKADTRHDHSQARPRRSRSSTLRFHMSPLVAHPNRGARVSRPGGRGHQSVEM